ncbi:MAG: twin-arginine translocase subunit TatC [Tabrizicola sp.]|jgi:sec-independent protein translocase protein TatC|uniref:twin-arginine translocase subunit TatC n=1 Tax=Tabrizicola sp. TaxID=2005166 RepID=UPI001B7A0A13|nr:twin-arginine translocase subunit TatC [Tabrizicola sp.]MCC6517474.1 twin-arginine translocase subunit TatC [Tabrizicola sp.]
MTKQDSIDDSSAPLIEHLAELRNRILYSIAAFTAAFLFAWVFWKPVFDLLSAPLCNVLVARGQQCQLVLIKMQEGFFVSMKIGLWGGFALAFPVIAYQLYRFVAPGLYRSEKAAFLPFLVASPIMFCLGGAVAYFVILPWAFDFFLSYQDSFKATLEEGSAVASNAPAGVVFQGSMESYLALTMSFVMAFGICFQLPVLLSLMGRAGLASSRGLRAMRKYAVVGILAVAAMVTPPDVMSQLILFAVIYPLYEISIFLVSRFEKQRETQMRADGTWVDIDEDDEAEAGSKA